MTSILSRYQLMKMRGADRLAGVEQLGAHALGDIEERLRLRAVRRADDDRRAAVRGLADHDVERNLAEERHALFLGLVAGAAVREHVGAASAMRALEIAHVLDDAE